MPGDISDEEADRVFAEYTENGLRIRALCESRPKSFFFGIVVDDEDLEAKEREALVLMARNYVLIERLRGSKTIFTSASVEKKMIGDYLKCVFTRCIASSGEAV